MKKMIGLLLVSGALLAVPSASSLQANVLDVIITGGPSDNGDRQQLKDCDDPLYDGSGSENSGDGICDYL